MFTGLSAFPITPFSNEEIDYSAFERLMSNLVSAEVDSICAMGSTGLYPYLSREELGRVAKVAVDNANGIPIMVGVGALRTKDVLKNVGKDVPKDILEKTCLKKYWKRRA